VFPIFSSNLFILLPSSIDLVALFSIFVEFSAMLELNVEIFDAFVSTLFEILLISSMH
jgi:hypothetical protein